VLDRVLEVLAAVLMVALTVIIVLGFGYRYAGYSLVWYDEIASIGLAWLTYYAGALAALHGAHIGFPGLVNAFPAALRIAATLFAEALVIVFFVVLAATGIEVLVILEGLTLVSLPEVPMQIAQSVIPITAVLFVFAVLLRLPDTLAEARRGTIVEHELKEALASVEGAPR
jgi:TRAP-type C4-dicarboxylate transport system permease small subunit